MQALCNNFNEVATNAMLRVILLSTIAHVASAQGSVPADTTDSPVRKITIHAQADLYYAYNFNRPEGKDQPYLVTMARHNEMNVNLAFVDVVYTAPRVRARLTPGFGTYMHTNYSAEPKALQNIVEASAGYRLSESKDIWIDAGIMTAPYTNEGVVSKDQNALTRSLASELSPYYMAAVRLRVPLSPTVLLGLHITNGWQQISDQNANKSFGTYLEVRPDKSIVATWSTYAGNEKSAVDSVKGLRIFNDFTVGYTREKWTITSCAYAGIQRTGDDNRVWWQANLIGKYALNARISFTGRLEFFVDNDRVIVVPVTGASRFRTMGSSLGLNVTPASHVILRTEVRYLFSGVNVYSDRGEPASNSVAVTTGAVVWF
jgi:hypothetical protein